MNAFGPRKSVSFVLIAINVAVFFVTLALPQLKVFLAVSPVGLFGYGFVWTPLTYMFVHGSMTHLLFNMIFLIFAAPAVEERMGSREFLAFYLISGTLAGLFSVLAYWSTGLSVPIVGASGAIYAVMLAFATFYPHARFLIFYVLPMRAPYALALFAGIDLLQHIRGTVGVAHLTHLSGLAFGYLYFMIRLRMNPIKEMRKGL
ncbi:MAG: rhomboid family intramembrane serine protease [Spirochaetales bacterium]|nr:rhomboid family intramembrane serine protease [Spirochaetales bacterium]